MAGEPMSYWDYVKAAFWKPVRSRVLGAMLNEAAWMLSACTNGTVSRPSICGVSLMKFLSAVDAADARL